ncbi:DUF3325 domain-containing protein [Erythrobacter sp. W302b]|uniref:DUF3325 domain-containing protein n=1 Tax=Erythrobacter sp. W302b TaxID=3389874 RepID=UPI00396AF5C9
MTALLFTCAMLTAIAGCACLALSQERHWKAVSGTAPHARRTLRVAGWAQLGLSLASCILCDGASFAALLWPLLVMLAALVMAAVLTWRPRLLHPLARLLSPKAG